MHIEDEKRLLEPQTNLQVYNSVITWKFEFSKNSKLDFFKDRYVKNMKFSQFQEYQKWIQH